jgi:negative regulator of genetic competence, sporulation and motility
MPLSPKLQELFQDLLEMAYRECGFEIEEDSQLMVEAYPLTLDSFVIIMTKIPIELAKEQSHSFMGMERDLDEDEELLDRGQDQVWFFGNLEDCTLACGRITPDYVEASALYKFEEGYYLAIKTITDAHVDVGAIMGEYGEWVPASEAFFIEHGTVLAPANAIVNLASIVR